MTLQLHARGEADMEALGRRLGQALPRGLLFLEGPLGAGKTTLTRGLLRGFGHLGAVKSPTYTLVEPYQLGAHCLFHFDLYRLGDPEELEFIGIRDYLAQNALCVVEWPARGEGVLPAPDLRVTVTAIDAGRARALRLAAHTPLGRAALARLQEPAQQEPSE